ncbi:MAG: glycine C-acetyltransferase [Desulfuromonadaceae bacterium GWC2_58_13]|nr:MAG: glycine C-acetyltransferase [Desulfuromonadaceae bacterium GWC2_58_13]
MDRAFYDVLARQGVALREECLYKEERPLGSPQSTVVRLSSGREVINLCANNYLGLANHPDLLAAAKRGLDERGFGMASVRFICGTQDSHRELERKLSGFLGSEDALLYSSCFDANGGLFEPLLDENDVVISDALNHASIIDGIRLCKARRLRYANNDMAGLEDCLRQSRNARYRLIATDGVFSMDGVIADLPRIVELAKRYEALTMVDDSHAVGVLGEKGRGTHEYRQVLGQIDIITGTLGKALGGAGGGYTAGRRELIEWLRQRSRPYLFSNALAPPVVYASLRVLEMLEQGDALRARLLDNSRYFRERMAAAGFRLAGADHPIIPILIGDAALSAKMAERLLDEGIYVVGFSFPVVPKGQARIRAQLSAAHSREQLAAAIDAFTRVGRELGVIR